MFQNIFKGPSLLIYIIHISEDKS